MGVIWIVLRGSVGAKRNGIETPFDSEHKLLALGQLINDGMMKQTKGLSSLSLSSSSFLLMFLYTWKWKSRALRNTA